MKHLRLWLIIAGTCISYTCLLSFVDVPWSTSVRTTEQRISIHLLPTAPSISTGAQTEEIPEENTFSQPNEQTEEPEPTPKQEPLSDEPLNEEIPQRQEEQPPPQETPAQPLPDVDMIYEKLLERLRERTSDNTPLKPINIPSPSETMEQDIEQERPISENIPQEVHQEMMETPTERDIETPHIEWSGLEEQETELETVLDTEEEPAETPEEPTTVEQASQAPIEPRQGTQAATTVEQPQTVATQYIDVESTTVAPQFPLEQLRRRIVYPPVARRQGQEGTVLLELWISAEGTIERIEVLEDPGYGMAQAAKNAFAGLSCTPGVVNGRNVAVRMRYPIRFSLR